MFPYNIPYLFIKVPPLIISIAFGKVTLNIKERFHCSQILILFSYTIFAERINYSNFYSTLLYASMHVIILETIPETLYKTYFTHSHP